MMNLSIEANRVDPDQSAPIHCLSNFWDGLFGYPQCMFWYRNRKISYWLHTPYPSVLAGGVGAIGNPLIETVLLSTHNVCLVKKLVIGYTSPIHPFVQMVWVLKETVSLRRFF